MHRTTISCNTLIMSSSRRPPGDGKEEVQHQEPECSLQQQQLQQQQYKKMTRYEEKPPQISDRCDGKDSSPLSSASATPPFMKWSEGLHHLLNDEDGIHLFIQYLEQENLGTLGLEFWLACVGMRKKWQDEQNNDGRNFIRLLNSAFVSRLDEISTKTKRDIADKIKSGEQLSCNIFDVAQREVEEKVLTTTYLNFLQSDIYLQYVQQIRAESMRKNGGVGEGSQDIDTCGNQDNENSKEGSPKKGHFGSVRSNSQEALDVLPTLVEDRELELNRTVNKMGLTEEHLWKRRFADFGSRIKPELEAGHYLKAKTAGYNTAYHARYATFLPPSAQDSELQSLSSDAQTDDNISLSDSTIVEYNLPTHSKCSSRASDKYRSNKSYCIMNKDSIPCDFVQKRKSNKVLKPQSLNSEEFRKQLMERLLKLQVEKSQEEMKAQSILDEHVSRVWAPSAQQTPTRTPGSLTPPPPPTIQPSYNNVEGRQRAASSNAVSNQNLPHSYSYSQYNKAVVNQPYLQHNDSIRHRRESDSISCDSGTMHDYSSDTGRLPGFVSDGQHGDFASSAEYKRRLKEQAKRSGSGKKLSAWESRSSFDSGVSLNHIPVCNDQQKKPTRKSYPNMMPSSVQPTPPEITPVLYSYGRGTNTVPYLSKLPGKNITLKQFKSLLKKGNFRYFFKKDIPDFGIVYEEITEDNEVLPLWEGKIHSVIEVID